LIAKCKSSEAQQSGNNKEKFIATLINLLNTKCLRLSVLSQLPKHPQNFKIYQEVLGNYLSQQPPSARCNLQELENVLTHAQTIDREEPIKLNKTKSQNPDSGGRKNGRAVCS
jgi:hypothetical protein